MKWYRWSLLATLLFGSRMALAAPPTLLVELKSTDGKTLTLVEPLNPHRTGTGYYVRITGSPPATLFVNRNAATQLKSCPDGARGACFTVPTDLQRGLAILGTGALIKLRFSPVLDPAKGLRIQFNGPGGIISAKETAWESPDEIEGDADPADHTAPDHHDAPADHTAPDHHDAPADHTAPDHHDAPADHTAPDHHAAASPDDALEVGFKEALSHASRLGVPDAELAKATTPSNYYFRSSDVAILVFNEKGEALFAPQQIDEDDKLIILAVSSDADTAIQELRVTTCDAANPVRVSPDLVKAPFPGEPVKPKVRYRIAIADACSKDTGMKAVVRTDKDTTSHDITLKTLALYRITVGLGLIYDFSLKREFRAAALKGESVPVIIKDEHVQGLTPPIALVSLRLPAATSRGRSLRLPEMFGVSAGFSLVEPLDHLYLGLLFEPFAGFGFTFGHHFHTVPTLAGGYQENDRIPSGQVPVDKRWEADGRSWFVGLNLDASLFATILGAVTK